VRVTVTKITDEKLMQLACSFTINKESKMPLERIYQCKHSPIRALIFVVEMYDIPTFVSVHLTRHSLGVTHYVKSNREDRMGYSGDLGRMQPVNHMMFINAEALINMAHKRLCSKTHKLTTEVMQLIKEAVAQVDPALAKYMVRQCEYLNGRCDELRCCGNIYVPTKEV